MPLTDSVFNKVDPEATSNASSPLIVSFTFPEGTKKFLATNRMTTSSRITTRNTPTLANIKFISIVVYFTLLDVQTRETHKRDGHQTYSNKRNAQSSQWSRHIRISHFFTNSGQAYDCQEPTDTRT